MGVTVLIVDDLAFVRMMIRDILSKHGFQIVAEASNGAEGIKKFLEARPDIVLLDITMPVMNGLDALKKIMELNPAAKVIMCSALGQQKLIVTAIQIGAKDFIVKPFKEERLVSAVKKISEKK